MRDDEYKDDMLEDMPDPIDKSIDQLEDGYRLAQKLKNRHNNDDNTNDKENNTNSQDKSNPPSKKEPENQKKPNLSEEKPKNVQAQTENPPSPAAQGMAGQTSGQAAEKASGTVAGQAVNETGSTIATTATTGTASGAATGAGAGTAGGASAGSAAGPVGTLAGSVAGAAMPLIKKIVKGLLIFVAGFLCLPAMLLMTIPTRIVNKAETVVDNAVEAVTDAKDWLITGIGNLVRFISGDGISEDSGEAYGTQEELGAIYPVWQEELSHYKALEKQLNYLRNHPHADYVIIVDSLGKDVSNAADIMTAYALQSFTDSVRADSSEIEAIENNTELSPSEKQILINDIYARNREVTNMDEFNKSVMTKVFNKMAYVERDEIRKRQETRYSYSCTCGSPNGVCTCSFPHVYTVTIIEHYIYVTRRTLAEYMADCCLDYTEKEMQMAKASTDIMEKMGFFDGSFSAYTYNIESTRNTKVIYADNFIRNGHATMIVGDTHDASVEIRALGFDPESDKPFISTEGVISVDKGQIKAIGEGKTTLAIGGHSVLIEVYGGIAELAIKYADDAVANHMRYSQDNRMAANSADCSSFVWRAYKYAGISLGGDGSNAPVAATIAYNLNNTGKTIYTGSTSPSNLKPGDLIFYSTSNFNGENAVYARRYKHICHVAMYVGDKWVSGENVGQIVHAAGVSEGVTYSDYKNFRFDKIVLIARPTP